MSSRKRKGRSPDSSASMDIDRDENEVPAVSQITELRPRDEEEAVAVSDEEDAEEPEDKPDADLPVSRGEMKRVLESLIFVSDEILTAQQLARMVKAKLADVRELIAELCLDYVGRGIEIVEINGGYQFRSAASSGAYVRDLVEQRPARLTRAQLETLALIAYRQPITRPEIDDVRGVDSGSAIKVLGERDLVKILGRKDEAGRPLLYGTTPFFLEFFSMNSMQDLPTLREFTELSQEHRELFQRKTGEVPDLSAEAERIETEHAEAAREAEEEQLRGEDDEVSPEELAEAEADLDAPAPEATSEDAASDEHDESDEPENPG